MATQAHVLAQPGRDQLLRRALTANLFFSLATGAAMLLAGGPIAALLGLASPLAIQALGAAVLAFCPLLWAIARRSPIDASHVRIILALDVAWVLASALLIALNPFGLSSAGLWLVAGLADLVAVIALFEYLGLRRLARS